MSDKEKALIAALNGSQVASTGASLSEASSELDAHLDAHLDEVFATARQTRPEVPVSLQAAILADAALLQKARVEVLTRQTAGQAAVQASGQITGQITGQMRARQSAALRLWQQFAAAVGGWPALGGMAAASLAGLWIGLAPPSFLPDPVERYAAFSTGSQLMTDLGYDVSLLMGDEVFE